MYDELTEVDIKKMEEEIAYRQDVLAPKLLAEMSRTRAFGDLSENAEYKEAKREKRRNEGRIRYLLNMIRTARVIEVEDTDRGEGRVALFEWVVVFNEAIGKENVMKNIAMGAISNGWANMGSLGGKNCKLCEQQVDAVVAELQALGI